MNKSIKILALAFLWCSPVVYSMNNDTIIPTNDESLILPSESLYQIFEYAALNEIAMIGKFRSVCKFWYAIFNPVAIRQIFNLNAHDHILGRLCAFSLTDNDSWVTSYVKFHADMLEDTPDKYNHIMDILISRNLHPNLKILLENGANPNYYNPISKKSLLNEASNNMKMFKLLLQYGGDIDHDLGDGQKIIDIALTNALHGNCEMIKTILQEKYWKESVILASLIAIPIAETIIKTTTSTLANNCIIL